MKTNQISPHLKYKNNPFEKATIKVIKTHLIFLFEIKSVLTSNIILIIDNKAQYVSISSTKPIGIELANPNKDANA